MPRVLHVQASPRGDESFSIRVARAFLEAYAKAHPGNTLETLDLVTDPPPPFRGDEARAKMRILGGQAPAPEQAKAWARVTETIRRFKTAEKFVFSAPMWNFALPYHLKHYLDVLIQPGETFRYTPEGKVEGLLRGRPCMLILARGGRYGPGSGGDPSADSGSPRAGSRGEAMDFQLPYLKAALGFIGFERIETILIEPTAAEGPDAAEKALAAAFADARRRAADF
ncbi:MAG: NAD(P)H-dependent oxidoreductase [Phycisphaerae bacterium]